MIFAVSAASKFVSSPSRCALQSNPRLGAKAKLLAAELKSIAPKEIRKQLHVNDALAQEYQKHLSNFESKTPVPACSLYDSSFFRGFGAVGYDKEDAEWANRHVRVFSGLYGLLRPFDVIQPLSLPVTLSTKLKNSKGNHLRDYWRDVIAQELTDALKSCPIPVLINCAHEQDGEIINPDELPEHTRIVDVRFKMNNTKATGQFVRWALENRCYTVEELLEFQGPNDDGTIRIDPKESRDNIIMFEEATADGGDDAWGRKFSESGMSKTAFIKEKSSGKNKYRRAEINKTLAKEEKRKKSNAKSFY